MSTCSVLFILIWALCKIKLLSRVYTLTERSVGTPLKTNCLTLAKSCYNDLLNQLQNHGHYANWFLRTKMVKSTSMKKQCFLNSTPCITWTTHRLTSIFLKRRENFSFNFRISRLRILKQVKLTITLKSSHCAFRT